MLTPEERKFIKTQKLFTEKQKIKERAKKAALGIAGLLALSLCVYSLQPKPELDNAVSGSNLGEILAYKIVSNHLPVKNISSTTGKKLKKETIGIAQITGLTEVSLRIPPKSKQQQLKPELKVFAALRPFKSPYKGVKTFECPAHLPHCKKYEKVARKAAIKHGIDQELFLRQIAQESGFNPKARSYCGAEGIAQIMPGTAKTWKVDPKNPEKALNAAAKNMAGYYITYLNDKKLNPKKDKKLAYKLALAAYNAGTGSVKKYKSVPPYKETKRYVSTILTHEPTV